MYELKPKNEYAWIKPHGEADKVGAIYVPGTATNQYRTAELLGFDEDSPRAKGYEVGQTVLYDVLGSTEHRIGNSMYVTVKLANIVAIIQRKTVAQ